MNITEYEYSKLVTIESIFGEKHLFVEDLPSLVGELHKEYNLPLNDEVVQGMKDGIIFSMFEGIDPEWKSLNLSKWWDNLNSNSFKFDSGCKKICFVDSTHPRMSTPLFAKGG